MKPLLAVSALFLLTLSVFSQAPAKTQTEEEQPWDFVSFTFVPGVPQTADIYNVYGVKIGIPIGTGAGTFVAGVEGSIFASMSDEVYGVQAAPLYNSAKKIGGLQATFLVNNAESANGLQFGLVNFAKSNSFQIGLLNFIKDSSIPFFPLINFRF